MDKLVAIDIDGTLLNSHGKITDKVFESIKRAKDYGVHIALCSGRPNYGLLPVINCLPKDSVEFVIAHNGALVQEVKTGKIISAEVLSKQDFEQFAEIAAKLNAHLCFHGLEGMYTLGREVNASIADNVIVQNTTLKILDDITGPLQHNILKCQFLEDDPTKIDEIMALIPKQLYQDFYIVRSVIDNLEIMNRTVNKWHGISQLAKYLNIDDEDTIGIGDEENDREMLENVALSIVMENGNQALKSIATIITKSNDESGVAYALENYIYKNQLVSER